MDVVIQSLQTSKAFAPETLAVHAVRMGRFALFAQAQGVQSLDDVTPAVAAAFVHSRRVTGERPTDSERGTRLSSVRRLYREARRLGLVSTDPTVDIKLPRPVPVSARPLTDREIEVGRAFAVRQGDTRPSVCWALAEATARPSEIRCLRVSDLDLEAGTAWIHGGRSTDPRPGRLSSWGVAQLERRLRTIGSGERPNPLLVGDEGWARSVRARNAVTQVLRLVLKAAGLRAPGVNPMSIPAWAGATALANGVTIDEVAKMLGVRSLDGAAALIGWDWRGPR